MYRLMLFLEFGEFGPLFLPIVFLHTLLLSLLYLGGAHYEYVGMFDCIPTGLWGSVIFFFILFSFCFLERIVSIDYLQLLSPLLFLSPTQIYCWILLMDLFISVILLVSSRIATCFIIMVSTSFISSVWEDIVFLLLIL